MALANTDKLTSQLAMLPDNALRQMAQMHKNDPYVLPLIIAEDGRRKQLRMAGQAQQYRPQPKVADAQAAQVGAPLPEEVGIGMLPAPNMAQMAGGGITGDDDVPGYQTGGTVALSNGGETAAERARRLVRMAQARAAFSGPVPFSYGLTPGAAAAGLGVAAIPVGIAGGLTSAMEAMREAGYPVDQMGEFATEATPEQLAFDAARLAKQREAAAAASAPTTGGPAARFSAAGLAPSTVASGQTPSTATSERTPAAEQRRPAEKPPAPSEGTKTSMQSLDALYENLRKKYGPGAEQADPFDKQRKVITEAKVSERRQALEDFEKDVAARTPFGAEREKRLLAKEEKLGQDEKQLGGLALLEAGLAIMGGTSPYAAANIGAGAGVGLKAYKQGKKEIEDARDKLDDARSLIDEYRRNEAELTKKERRGLQRDIRNAQTEGLESLLSGAEKMYGFAREDVKTMLGAAVTERAAHIKGGYELQAAKLRGATGQDQRLAALAQRTLTDIRNAAQKQFPYPTQNAQREKFVNDQLAQALQYNPDLAQYMGAAGGGGAPSAAPSFRYNQQTGQVEPVR